MQTAALQRGGEDAHEPDHGEVHEQGGAVQVESS
jgi:hypothetical protein